MHPFRRDPKLPHIITLLATEARPLERLSAGEVAAVVCLAEDFCTKSPYEAHDMYADIDAFPVRAYSSFIFCCLLVDSFVNKCFY